MAIGPRHVRIGAGGMVTSRTIGVQASVAALGRYRRNIGGGVHRGVKKSLQYLLRETLPVTPKANGDLRKSGRVHIDGTGERTTGYVAFHMFYAVYVHEDLTKAHAPGTYAKFLERTAKRVRINMRAIMLFEIQDACRRALANSTRKSNLMAMRGSSMSSDTAFGEGGFFE